MEQPYFVGDDGMKLRRVTVSTRRRCLEDEVSIFRERCQVDASCTKAANTATNAVTINTVYSISNGGSIPTFEACSIDVKIIIH